MDAPVIDTPDGRKTLHVCKDGTLDDDDWVSVYDVSFPPDQRQDLGELEAQLRTGQMELDETRDQDGTILCMTLSEVFRNSEPSGGPAFLLACYTAVVPRYRGLGVGSIHRRKLDELLQREYPHYLGIFSEIESTHEAGLDAATLDIRVRRKRFFLKLGLQPIDIDYRFPSYTQDGAPLQGELLWVPFGSSTLPPETLIRVLRRIYTEGYGLKSDDPLIERVVSQSSLSSIQKRSLQRPDRTD